MSLKTMSLKKMSLFPLTILGFLALLAPMTAPAAAAESAAIGGTVTDATGAVLPGTWVTLSLAAGGEMTASTDRRGAFRFDGVPSGDHSVKFELSGFLTVSQPVAHGSSDSDASIELSISLAEQLTVRDAVPYRSLQAETATRTETPLLEVPQSIQVLPIEIAESQAAQTVNQLLRNVSGAVPDTGFQGTQDGIFLRGFGVSPVLRNGYRRAANIGLSSLANVDRVEVLKGPAAVLYGSGSPGGVVNLVTKRPLPQVARSAAFEVGSFEHYGAMLDLTGPLGSNEDLRYRLNLQHQDFGSWRDNVEGTRTLIAPVVSWDANESTVLVLEGEYYEQSLPAFGTGALFIDGSLIELPVETNLSAPWAEFDRDNTTLSLYFNRLIGGNVELRGEFQTVDYNERTLSDYVASVAEDGRTATNEVYLNDFDVVGTDTLRVEAVTDIDGGSTRHTLLVGTEVFEDNFGGDGLGRPSYVTDIFNPTFPANPPDLGPGFFFEQELSLVGFYAQDQIDFGDRFRALLGVRWDRLETAFRFERGGTFDPADEDEAWSPRVGLVYMARPDVSLFAGYARSFEPNGRTDFLGNYLEPQRGTQYEIGAKWLPREGRLSVNTALFQLTRSNVVTVDRSDPRFFVPVGEQRSQGVEIDIAGRLSDRLRMVASASYLWESEITEDMLRPVGSNFVNVPEETASLWLTYDLPELGWDGMTIGGGIFYAGDRPGELALDPFLLDSYLLVDASVEFRVQTSGRSFSIALNGKNLTDERYVEAGQGEFANYYGQPRSTQLTLRTRF
ncbi:MAG: TonB-dependent receptor [Acidobacteriota bacterium]